MDFLEDLRVQELQSLLAIYGEACIDIDSVSGSLVVPINEQWDVSCGSLSQSVDHLPSLQVTFSLPEDYPMLEPPTITLSCWILNNDQIKNMKKLIFNIWDGYRDQVLFSCIDYLQQQLQENLATFLVRPLVLTPEVYHKTIAFNQQAIQDEFDCSSFDCEICQESFSGAGCSQFTCSHVFCNNCLRDYFKGLITLGEIEKVHCPSYACTKERVKLVSQWNSKISQLDTNLEELVASILTPAIPLPILTRILDSSDLVNRYHDLHLKTQYDFVGKLLPNRVVQCPVSECGNQIFRRDTSDQLVQCTRCNYAFCKTCRRLWHSKFVDCRAESGDYVVPVEAIESYQHLTKDDPERKVLNARYGHKVMILALREYEMDQLFKQLLRDSNDCAQCPSCDVVIEKSDGCNMMTCSRCFTKFCFLCGYITDASHEHFADPESTCYRKLFHGMPGMDQFEDFT